MQTENEMTSMFYMPCRGANPESQLPTPVNVLVAGYKSGEVGIGCPYLILSGFNPDLEPPLPVFACLATSSGRMPLTEFEKEEGEPTRCPYKDLYNLWADLDSNPDLDKLLSF